MAVRIFIMELATICLCFLLIGIDIRAEAQSSGSTVPQPARSNVIKKKASLSFEDELVEGGTQKPDLFYLFQKKNFNYKRLIRLRENFLPEMRRASEDIHRPRSGS
jgi:hypothetical protein